MWLRTSQEGIYYRLLGEQIKCEKAEYHRVRVPALDRIFETHQSAHGPWRSDWWDTLTGTLRVPVLTSKWTGTRESLEAIVGMSKQGDTMPQYMWQYLRQQEPVYNWMGYDTLAQGKLDPTESTHQELP